MADHPGTAQPLSRSKGSAMNKLRVKAQEYGEQQLEALGMPAVTEFELNDGSTVQVWHPWLWDDRTETAAKEAEKDGDEPYTVRLAKAVLGKDHARFIKGGGKSSQIAMAIELMKVPQKDADPKGS